MFIGSRSLPASNIRDAKSPPRGLAIASMSSSFGSSRKEDERSLQLADFVGERGIGKSRRGEIARIGKLLEPQGQLGSALPAEAARRALERMGGALQRGEIARIERFADLEQALGAVFQEQLGELLQKTRVAAHHREQARLVE